MTRRHLLALLLALSAPASCEPTPAAMPAADKQPAAPPEVPEGAEVVTLGAGCFWCIEAAYRQMDGVLSATSGYMGGHLENPTYEQITRGDTGHAEVVHLVFDPKKTSLSRILDWFWKLHDPTTPNRQGNDIGPQYRSAIFFHNEDHRKIALESKQAAAKDFRNPIVTEITKAATFYPAENYHQNYYFENKSKNPYCKVVIEPKLKKLELKH